MCFCVQVGLIPISMSEKGVTLPIELPHDPVISFHYHHCFLQSFIETSHSTPFHAEQL